MLTGLIKKITEDKVVILQIETVNKILVDAELIQMPNSFTKPKIDDSVFIIYVNESYPIALMCEQFNLDLEIKEGEQIIYSRDEDNKITAKITLKATGDILIETPNNLNIKITENIEINGKTVMITDENKNKLTMDDKGILIEDKNKNKIEMAASGVIIKNKAGRKIEMGKTSVDIS